MSLPITPDTIAAAYEFLRVTPPFRGWRLPHADEVKFTVNRHRTWLGSCQGGTTPVITISSHIVGYTDTLLRVVAHEMIHLHQWLVGTETPRVMHNAAFYRHARAACNAHGWDPKVFV